MNHQTERDALEARIRVLEGELDRVHVEFATFSGRLSHDLQGIFRNIDGFACALQEQAGGKLSEREARYVQRIRAGGQRGDSMARDLASLAAAAAAVSQPSAVDPAGLVDQCIRDLSPRLEGRTVEWELAGKPWPRVTADRVLLQLALGHLLANAVKFTRDRAPARIRVAVAATPQEWVASVADNGAGFDPAYVERLFHAFERLHLPTEFEGNGVGLALVKLVAQRHGGRVHAEAPPEGGAVFRIALGQHAGAVAAAARPRDRAVAAGERAGRKIRVLVVDDEPLVLATVKAMLERDGHEVVAAGGGAAALQALEQHAQQARPFDLVISDWLMPDVGGAEVVLAAKAFHPATRAIVLTGQRPDTHGRHDVPAAVDHVLGKPLTPAELRRAVAAVAGRVQAAG